MGGLLLINKCEDNKNSGVSLVIRNAEKHVAEKIDVVAGNYLKDW